MTKHRRTRRRRSQKGGGVLDYFGFGSSEPTESYAAPTQSWGEYFSSWGTKGKDAANSLNTTIGNVAASGANVVSDATSSVVSTVSAPFSSSENTTSPSGQSSEMEVNSYGQQGGRRRKRSIKGGSNLAYYAAPVSGLKVAEPTTWQYYVNGPNQYSVKGGSRKRKGRKGRRTRRHKKR